MPNTEGLTEGEGSLFPFDLSQVGSQPQRVFDILQEDVSEEAFYDKPSWVGPESDACNSLLSQPACSFSRPFFPTRLGFPFVSLCSSLFAGETSKYTLFSVLSFRKYSCILGQKIPMLFKLFISFQLGTQKHLKELWEVLY